MSHENVNQPKVKEQKSNQDVRALRTALTVIKDIADHEHSPAEEDLCPLCLIEGWAISALGGYLSEGRHQGDKENRMQVRNTGPGTPGWLDYAPPPSRPKEGS